MKDMYGIDCKPHLAMPQRARGAACHAPTGAMHNAPTGAMRNAPTGQTVIAQGNALGTNVPPKPPSPNGANDRVNHVAPSGQRIIGGGHTQGVALGYRRSCRWHIGQNDDTPIAMTQFTKIQSNTWQSNAKQPLANAPPHDELDNAPPHDEQTRKDQTHDDPTFKSPTHHAPIRNARTRNAPIRNARTHNAPIRNARTRNAPIRNARTRNAPIRNARTRNAPTGQTVIAQGNALGTNVPPKPPSPNGANERVNYVAPSGQACIRGRHTQGDALGYHSLCRWHIGTQGIRQLRGMLSK